MHTPVPILLYHSIAPHAPPGFKRFTLAPDLFAAHMSYLHDQDYTPMTVSQLVQMMREPGTQLPARPVVITFDDGLSDFYSDALPVLQRHGFAATLYVTTSFIGGVSGWLGRDARPMLAWPELGEISAGGIECGAHSHTHPQLDTLPIAAARDEIVRSKMILEHRLGRPVATFAYPHGYHGPAVRRLVLQAGYTSACAVKHARSATTDDRFALARIVIDADMGVMQFARLLAVEGLPTAPRRERVQTTGWRIVRRLAAPLRRRLRPTSGRSTWESGWEQQLGEAD
jgi:peptidoglycan/xylan/chitin deacetylase (PgdA/CDA1 family)